MMSMDTIRDFDAVLTSTEVARTGLAALMIFHLELSSWAHMCRRPTRLPKTMLRLRVESPLEKITRARASQEFIPFDDHDAAREHGVGHARNLNSFKHRIVNAHVMSLCTDGMLAVRIKYH